MTTRHIFKDYQQALSSLKEGVPKTNNLLERDGAIHRFEYTIELSWKLLQSELAERKMPVRAPRTVYREAYKEGLVKNVNKWLAYWDMRNLTSHVYREMTADEIYKELPGFVKLAEEMVKDYVAAKERV